MEIYLVGGAVRDSLLGLVSKDKDYVVVGATDKDMLDAGYTRVGAFFPVFIHPDTGCEYALARKERKISNLTSNPHQDFTFVIEGVALEDDLKRRDLTMNAIAFNESSGEYLDPYGGIYDIKNKIIKHVSEAFIEDPLRVFRVARFSARFSDFTIAPETLDLMRKVVSGDDFKNLSMERVYKEMEACLNLSNPSIFFETLKKVGGLEFYFPELHALIDVPQSPVYHPEGDCWVHTMLVLDHAAKNNSLEISFAALVHDLGKGITPKEVLPKHINHENNGLTLVENFCDRLKVPNSLREAGLVVTKNHLKVHRIEEMSPNSIVRLFYAISAFKKPHIINVLARACEADDLGKNRTEVRQGILLEEYFNVVKDVSIKDIQEGLVGEAIYNEIRATRVRKLKKYIREG